MVDTTIVGAGATRATSCSCTPAPPSRRRGGRRCLRGPTSCTRSSRGTSATPARCWPTWPHRPPRRPRTARACGPRTLTPVPGRPRRRGDARWRRAFAGGGRLFTFGNGGSSTDAASLAALFARPPWGRPLPARCLVDDTAILTALGNDVGFDLVFSRQLIAHGAAGDIALGLSTSGNSRNLLIGLRRGPRRGMLTVGLAGYDGGEMAASPDVEHCLVVPLDSVHRIQETQAALGFALWRRCRRAARGPTHG